MSMTITLTDDLAGQLRMQAQTRQLSVEQWALTILGHAAENPDELRSWANLHRRRFDLIQKRYSTGLDRAEEVELKQLQDSVAKLLEPADRRMLDQPRTKVGIVCAQLVRLQFADAGSGTVPGEMC